MRSLMRPVVRSLLRPLVTKPGPRNHSKGVGYSFVNAEAAALVARFTTQPDNTRKAQIDTLVGSLKTGGVWSKLDLLYLTAAHDSQAARQNWVADLYNLTAVSSPTFVVDRGYTGDGAASYLNTGFDPTVGTNKLVQNSAHMGLWSRTDLANGGGNSFDFGGVGNSYIARNGTTPGSAILRVNTAVGGMSIPGGYPGHSIWSRTAAGTWEAYAAGVDVGGGTDASAALTSITWGLCRAPGGSGGFGVNQIAAAHSGSALSPAEAAAAYNAIRTYLIAVGATT